MAKGRIKRFIPTKVGGYDIGTIVIAGLTKNIEERLLSPIIGNGTIVSGAIKIGIGLFLPKVAGSGKYARAIALGFGIDGIDDIISGFLGSGMPSGGIQAI